MLRSTLSRIVQALECESGSLLLYDTRANDLTITEMISPNAALPAGLHHNLSEGISGWVASNRKPLLVENIAKDERFAGLRNTTRSYKSDSFISAPLFDGDKFIGVVNVCERHDGSPFTPEHLTQLQSIASGITDAVRSGMAFRELSERGASLSEKVEAAARQLVQANFELAQMQGFHDSILRSISLGLLTFDRSLRVTFFNDTARRMFRLTDGDMNLKSLLKFRVEPNDGLQWHEVLEACIAEGKACTLRQARYLAPDGGELLLDLTCAPLDAGGTGDGGTLLAEDVGRTLQIERRLQQAEHLATLGKLAASVAHELNNPLDGVLRFTSLAMQLPGVSPKTLEYLRESKKGLERMSKIVKSLLDYSRSVGKGLEDLDLNELVTMAVRNLRPLQLHNNVTVKTVFSDEIPRVRFANFSEVFSNIIRNAYESMPMGGQLAISTELGDSSVVISFADTGNGVAPQIKDRIFEPFFTTKSTSECTGLGLSICTDIVSKHGGTIEVESSGQGATFRVRVPL